MIISILGCGWFGMPFGKALIAGGFDVNGSTTSTDKLSWLRNENINPFLITPSGIESNEVDPTFFQCDVLVITIPPKVRASASGDAYLKTMRWVIAQIKEHRIKWVLYTSSTAVFADRNGSVNENSTPDPETASGKLVFEVEQLLTAQNDFQTTIVRFAGLVGPGRDPGRFFAGKSDVPNGRAPVNLVHLDDCCGICLAIIRSMAFGYTIHACSPDHPQKQVFYSLAAKRTGLAAPSFVDELITWKIVDGLQVERLFSYAYKITSWSTWLTGSNI